MPEQQKGRLFKGGVSMREGVSEIFVLHQLLLKLIVVFIDLNNLCSGVFVYRQLGDVTAYLTAVTTATNVPLLIQQR